MTHPHPVALVLRAARAAALAAAFCALAGTAVADPRVRIRDVATPDIESFSYVAGGTDGSAYLLGSLRIGNDFVWRRTRVLRDGTISSTDVGFHPDLPFTWVVSDAAGTTAFLSTARVAILGPDGNVAELAGTLGVPRDAAMRDGLLHVVEERPAGPDRTNWGAETFAPDGARAEVADLGVVLRWQTPGELPLPGLGSVTYVNASPVSVHVDALGRLHAAFVVRESVRGVLTSETIVGRSIDALGAASEAVPLELPPRPSALVTVAGSLRVADDGTTWLVRTVGDPESGEEFVDLAARTSDDGTGSASVTLPLRAFPGAPHFHGDVAADGRFVAVASAVAGRSPGGAERALQLVWRRFDRPANGALRERRRVLLGRLASAGAARRSFEARAFHVAVAPDGACLVALASRAGPLAPTRLRLLVADANGRIVRRHSRTVRADVTIDTAVCGDRGFAVLVRHDSGEDPAVLHVLR